MKKQNISMIIFNYFSFGALIGVFFALLAMAISNTYVTHHDLPVSQTQHIHNSK